MSALLLTLFLLFAVHARAELPVLSLVADDTTPPIGTSLDLRVEAGAVDLSCLSFSVDYDPTILQYTGATEGPLFNTASASSYFSDDTDTDGNPQPNVCLLGFGTSTSGPGTAITLSFLVLDNAPTGIRLTNAVLRDVDRMPISGVGAPAIGLNGAPTGTQPLGLARSLHAFPNPSSGTIRFSMAGDGLQNAARLMIFDTAGRRVREALWAAGSNELGWNGRDDAGYPVANGVYHVVLETGTGALSTRIVRVR